MDTQFGKTLTLASLNIHPPHTSMGTTARRQHINPVTLCHQMDCAQSIYYALFSLQVFILCLMLRQISDNCRIQTFEPDNWPFFLQTVDVCNKDNKKEKRYFRSQRTKKIVLLYFFSPSEPQTSPLLLVVVFDGRDIDFFAEDRSVVYSKVYISQLSDHFLMINSGEPFLPRTPSSACCELPSAACRG